MTVQFDRTIEFPDPGFVTIDDIPAGAECLVIETSRSDPPAGIQWAGSLVTGPVTIVADETAALTVTNLLAEVQADETLTVEKTNNAPSSTRCRPPAKVPASPTPWTYTVSGTVTNGILKDVLPAGVTYTADSATDSDATSPSQSYDSATRTLTWSRRRRDRPTVR